MNSASPVRWKRQTIAILLFGISFGYVEAAVVTYLRPQFDAVRATFTPQSSRSDLFPMLSAQQIRAAGPDMVRLVDTEVAREAATLLMLGAVAAAVGGNFRQWFAFFLLAFGAWGISYYAFLKVLIDWPKSLLTWDVLFLIPVPWSGPVLAPALVALTGRNGVHLSVAGIRRSFDSAEGSSLARRLRGRVVYPGRLYLGLPQRHGWRDAEALQLAPVFSR